MTLVLANVSAPYIYVYIYIYYLECVIFKVLTVVTTKMTVFRVEDYSSTQNINVAGFSEVLVNIGQST
jgi:hypothetical protein